MRPQFAIEIQGHLHKREMLEEKNMKTKDIKTCKISLKCPHVASLILIALVVIRTLGIMHNNHYNLFGLENLVFLKQDQIGNENGPIPGCNLFSGKWVFDNISYPLYKEEQCSFIGYKFPACQKFGRKDSKYQNWRWQPHHCDIPRFNGSALLEKLKGKKLIFVGDSICRNQWESMFCLIKSSIPSSSYESWKHQHEGNFYIFYSSEYNVTIGHYWAPFLVESNNDKKFRLPRTVSLNSIEKHGRHWIDADILVFDNFAWWAEDWIMIVWGSFGRSDAIYKFVERTPRIYEIALNTWSDWLRMQINPHKTMMFFMSHSPYHFGPTLKDRFNCHGYKEPIFDDKYWPDSVNLKRMQVVESVIEKLEKRGVKIEYLNITQLSGYRIDAHPSIYLTTQNNTIHSDCLHWCLPGVPDIWNEILYAYIMKS